MRTTALTRHLLLIGIGVGDPDQLTVEAAAALGSVEVVFTVDKGTNKSDLNELRRRICQRWGSTELRIVELAEPERDRSPTDYDAEVARWHGRREQVWAQALRDELPEGGRGAFLVWGDPALYDSSLRILDGVRRHAELDLTVEVIPGITSVQLLTARHAIPLNTVGGAVHVTTGRRLADEVDGQDTVVVLLDGGAAWTRLEPADWTIYWGAYLGSADELLVAGPLAEVAADLEQTKRAARARKGWIMDVYLLRRTGAA